MEEKPKKRKATGAWGQRVKPPSDVPDWKKRGGKRSGWKVTYRDNRFSNTVTADLEAGLEQCRGDIAKAQEEGDLAIELYMRRRLRDAECELAWRRGIDDARSRKRDLRDWFGKEYEEALAKYAAMGEEEGKSFAEKLSEYYTAKYTSLLWFSGDGDYRDKILKCRIINELWQVRWTIRSPVSTSKHTTAYKSLRNSLEEFYLMIGGRDIDGVMLSPEKDSAEFVEVAFEHPQRPLELIAVERNEMARKE